MSKKRAFVRYSKQGKIVPGSLILTAGSHPNGPSTWKEVPADLCCDGGGGCGEGTVQLVVGDIEIPLPYTEGVIGVEFTTRCSDGPPFQDLKTVLYELPPEIINTYTDLLNWLNTYFNYSGYTWLLTGPSTLEVILDKKYLTCNCQNPDQVFFNWIPNTPA